MDQSSKVFYCGFTDNAISITGKIILPIFSNGWSHSQCHFFLTEGHERNILGNDNLPKVGAEVSQKRFSHYLNKRNFESIYLISPSDKEKGTDFISKTFKQLILRIRKTKNQAKITFFHEPLRPIQLKGRRVPLNLLETVKTELKRLKSGGNIKKLQNCDEDRIISSIVITLKMVKSIKLASGWNLLKKQIHNNK